MKTVDVTVHTNLPSRQGLVRTDHTRSKSPSLVRVQCLTGVKTPKESALFAILALLLLLWPGTGTTNAQTKNTDSHGRRWSKIIEFSLLEGINLCNHWFTVNTDRTRRRENILQIGGFIIFKLLIIS